MENALLVGLSQQAALRRHMDIVANNLANLSTSGFKSEQPIFEDFIMPLAGVGDLTGAAGEIHYVQDSSLFRDFIEGPLQTTNAPLDLAINGEGWFVLQGENGDLYTRNGHFKLNNEGIIVAANGDPVLTEDGPIQLAPGEIDFTVATDGTVTTSEGEKGTLRLVRFENEDRLQKQDAAVYSAPDDQIPEPTTDYRIAQGMLEGSNVNAVREITQMIQVTRAYTSTAQLLDNTNTLRRSAIETLGRAPS